MITKSILIIDDEDDIREVAQLTLEAIRGWQVLIAESGEEGLVIAQVEKPNAILLDVMMPDMDGVTTFKKLKANNLTCEIPVIFLTAKVQPAEKRRFLELGVKGVIAKPFDPMALSDQVTEILGW
ncbi:MAG: response regulator [Scytonematopsis contorta HA4267-MV1]|jgi:CheY-like chemotaxis protein|nr:response regulator [Scytonematopsis contorta HA4267-MV1]